MFENALGSDRLVFGTIYQKLSQRKWMSIKTPWIINTSQLEGHLNAGDVIVIDVSNKDSYARNHIPGAIFLDYGDIVKHQPPVVGMLPEEVHLSRILSNLGIKPDDYLIAYDDEGGGKASRFIWTLEITGHQKMSLLDGGIVNWLAENKPVTKNSTKLPPSDYPVKYTNTQNIADAEYILSHLNNPKIKILDARSANEFCGTDVRVSRAGHIPGAINIDWLAFKNANNQTLIEQSTLLKLLQKRAITPENEIIVHCHSHHRSALCYVALKHLGFKKVRGYPASWSDWASRTNTPIEN